MTRVDADTLLRMISTDEWTQIENKKTMGELSNFGYIKTHTSTHSLYFAYMARRLKRKQMLNILAWV